MIQIIFTVIKFPFNCLYSIFAKIKKIKVSITTAKLDKKIFISHKKMIIVVNCSPRVFYSVYDLLNLALY